MFIDPRETKVSILPDDTPVWIRFSYMIEERHGLVPETYYLHQGRMDSDGFSEYRLRAADGYPVYRRLPKMIRTAGIKAIDYRNMIGKRD